MEVMPIQHFSILQEQNVKGERIEKRTGKNA